MDNSICRISSIPRFNSTRVLLDRRTSLYFDYATIQLVDSLQFDNWIRRISSMRQVPSTQHDFNINPKKRRIRGMLQRRYAPFARDASATQGGHLGPENHGKSQRTWSVRKLFTLLGIFDIFFQKMSTNHCNPCSHIESNTTNPRTICKISIYTTN